MIKNYKTILVLLLAVTLTGCSSGGGGKTSNNIGSAPAPIQSSRPLTQQNALSANPSGFLSGASATATRGTSPFAQNLSFNGTDIAFSITRPGGSPVRLTSLANSLASATEGSVLDGYTAKGWALGNENGNDIDLAVAVVAWDNADPTDYLAAGYWMSVTGNTSSGNLTGGVQVGAFADGPELETIPPRLPAAGTATYKGNSQGWFTFEEGQNNPNLQAGTLEIGTYNSSVELTVDFGSGALTGCLACDGVTTVDGTRFFPDGSSHDFTERYNLRMNLNNARIAADASYVGSTSLVVSGRQTSRSRGAWSGNLSSINNSSGNPRVVGGIASNDWTGTNGANISMIGFMLTDEE